MAIITVTSAADGAPANDDVTTLREAIAQANADGSTSDTILFQPADMGSSRIVLSAGELLVTSDVVIDGGVQITVDADEASRVLHIQGDGSDVELRNLSITGGRTTGPEEGGGGIRAEPNTALTIEQGAVSGNATAGAGAYGGGVAAYGTLTLVGTTIAGNSTAGDQAQGGGVFGVKLTIYSGTITNNSTAGRASHGGGAASAGTYAAFAIESNSNIFNNTVHGTYARGGGVYSEFPLTVSDSAVTGNGSTGFEGHGGGLYVGSTLTLNQSEVHRNYTSGDQADGGGIWAPTVSITESTVDANAIRGEASHGGGVYARDQLTLLQATLSNNAAAGIGTMGGGAYVGTASVTSSTFAGNSNGTEGGGGGGIFGKNLSFEASTITGNSAQVTERDSGGGGILAYGPLTLHNTIVAGNTSSQPGPDIAGTITGSDGHNILGSSVAGTVAGDLVNITSAQLFAGGLAENGGPTQTVALLGEAANPALFHGAGGPPTDQRVEPRPAAAGTAPDAGAFELQQKPTAVLGGTRADSLPGTGDSEILRGLCGADRLHGGGSGDRLEGGGGDDRLVGGAGGDLLLGGQGADRFVFRAPSHSNASAQDLILDFSRPQGDHLDLRVLDGDRREPGDQPLEFIGRRQFENAGEVRYSVDQGHTVVEVNLDQGAAPELSFRLGRLIHLHEHDFLL